MPPLTQRRNRAYLNPLKGPARGAARTWNWSRWLVRAALPTWWPGWPDLCAAATPGRRGTEGMELAEARDWRRDLCGL